jgi:hypothetical protein
VKGSFKGPARQTLSVYVAVAYEDGNTFEELNNVDLHKESVDAPDTEDGSFAGQQ